MPDKKYVTSEDFDKFVNNDFFHVENSVDRIKSSVDWIKGIMALLIPLVLATLGVVITLALRE